MVMTSLAIDHLLNSGMTREAAAKEVARWLQRNDIPIRSKGRVAAWKTVLGWREELAKPGRRMGWDELGISRHVYRAEKPRVSRFRSRRTIKSNTEAKAKANRLLEEILALVPADIRKAVG